MDEPANEVAADSDNADRVVLVPGSQLAETLRGDGPTRLQSLVPDLSIHRKVCVVIPQCQTRH